MKKNHLKMFEEFSPNEETSPFNLMEELPEGYSFHMFGLDDDSLENEWNSTEYYAEAYGDIENWKSGLGQMGNIDYPGDPGRRFFRGIIEWEEMGLKYIYEIHPF